MTKDVLVSVRGIHTTEADGETGNVEMRGARPKMA